MNESRVFKIAVDLVCRDQTEGGVSSILQALRNMRSEMTEASKSAATFSDALMKAVSPAERLRDLSASIAEAMERAAAAGRGMGSMGGAGRGAGSMGGAGRESAGSGALPALVYGGGGRRGGGGDDGAGYTYGPRRLTGPGGRGGSGGGSPPGNPPPGDDEPFDPPGPIPLNFRRRAAPENDPSLLHGMATGLFAAELVRTATGAALGPAYKLGNEQSRVQARLDQPQALAALRAAREAQSETPGTTVLGNIGLWRTILSLTQNPGEANDLLPVAARYGRAMQLFNPEGGDYEAQVEDMLRAAEFRGTVMTKDEKGRPVTNVAGVENLMGVISRNTILSKSAENAHRFLAFMKAAGISGQQIGDADIPYYLPLIQSMGPAQAGTSLQGFMQQFGMGKMSEFAANWLIENGIIKGGGVANSSKAHPGKQNPYVTKAGLGTFRVRGDGWGVPNYLKILNHPQEFTEEVLLPAVQHQLAREQGKVYTGADEKTKRIMEGQALGAMASRIPGGTFMNTVINAWLQMQRDGAASKTINTSAALAALNNSPQAKVEHFSGALDHLIGTLGSPAMDKATTALGKLAGSMDHLTGWTDKHPAAVARGVEAGMWGLGTAALVPASRALRWAGRKAFGQGGSSIAGRVGAVADGAVGLVDHAVGWAGRNLPKAAQGNPLLKVRPEAGVLGEAIIGAGVVTALAKLYPTEAVERWVDSRIPGIASGDAWLSRHGWGGLSLFGNPTVGYGGKPAPSSMPTKANPLPVTIVGTVPAVVTNVHEVGQAAAHASAQPAPMTPIGSPDSHRLSEPTHPGRHG